MYVVVLAVDPLVVGVVVEQRDDEGMPGVLGLVPEAQCDALLRDNKQPIVVGAGALVGTVIGEDEGALTAVFLGHVAHPALPFGELGPGHADAVQRRRVVGRDVVGAQRVEVLVVDLALLVGVGQLVVAEHKVGVEAKGRGARHAVREHEVEHGDLEGDLGRVAFGRQTNHPAVQAGGRVARDLHPYPYGLVFPGLEVDGPGEGRQRVRPWRGHAHFVGGLRDGHVVHAEQLDVPGGNGRAVGSCQRCAGNGESTQRCGGPHDELGRFRLVPGGLDGQGGPGLLGEGARATDLPARRCPPQGDRVGRAWQHLAIGAVIELRHREGRLGSVVYVRAQREGQIDVAGAGDPIRYQEPLDTRLEGDIGSALDGFPARRSECQGGARVDRALGRVLHAGQQGVVAAGQRVAEALDRDLEPRV